LINFHSERIELLSGREARSAVLIELQVRRRRDAGDVYVVLTDA
jgi:hypothetical protein